MAIARAPRGLGVPFETERPVTAIQLERGAVRGVDTPAGPVQSPRAIVAAGPWGGSVTGPGGRRRPGRGHAGRPCPVSTRHRGSGTLGGARGGRGGTRRRHRAAPTSALDDRAHGRGTGETCRGA